MYIFGMDGKTIGQKIKELRLAKHLRQSDLEEMAGLYPRYLAQLENGYKQPRVRTLKKIADALEVGINELLEVEDISTLIPQAEPGFIVVEGRRIDKSSALYETVSQMACLPKSQQEMLSTIIRSLCEKSGCNENEPEKKLA